MHTIYYMTFVLSVIGLATLFDLYANVLIIVKFIVYATM